VPPSKPFLSSNKTVSECPKCLVAVRGEPLESYVTCKAPDATRVNIKVGEKNAPVHMFKPGGFRPIYTVTDEDHMVIVTCEVGNDDYDIVKKINKTLYVAGTISLIV